MPFFFRAHFRFEVVPQHIAGSLNTTADALSRNNISKFYYIFPQAPPHLPVTHSAPTRPQPQLNMEDTVQRLFVEGVATRTRSTYSSAQCKYIKFCQILNINPLPLSERSLCLFAAHLANEGLRAQSIKSVLICSSPFANFHRLPSTFSFRLAMASICHPRN